jgi:hypothetical protein
MGTRQSIADTKIQTAAVKKPPKCSVCRRVIEDTCDWKQGRCPHVPSLAQQIMDSPYKARFYNLIKFFKGNK